MTVREQLLATAQDMLHRMQSGAVRHADGIATGLLRQVMLGRNEGGLQHFHEWIDRFVAAPDTALLEEIIIANYFRYVTKYKVTVQKSNIIYQ